MIYGAGSALTALSWSVPTLALGWSILEGIGAALVLPALVALTAGNFEGKARAAAYGVLGGVAGAGIAVGPILGGWVTTNLTWRLVFAGEVVLVIAILLGTRLLKEPPAERQTGGLDWVGSVLSALGLSLVVFGVLQSSNWGWLQPRNSPITPLGFSLVPFVIAGGVLVLAGFRAWERRRERNGLAPLVNFKLLRIPSLRSQPGHVPRPERDPAGHLLHRAPLPPGRAGLRRVQDGSPDAPGLDRDARDRDGRVQARQPMVRAHDRPGRPGRCCSSRPLS